MLLPACPPGAVLSRTNVRRPSDAPYTAAASPAGPAPTTVRSYSSCSNGRRMPIRSARSRFVGLRSSSMLLHATTGVSASLTPNPLSRRSTSGSVSTSVQVKSTRFFARKSRTRNVDSDGLRLVTGMIDDLDFPGFYNEELYVPVPDLEQRRTARVHLRRDAGAAGKLVNVGLFERGKGDG